jgi:hypothetical protein
MKRILKSTITILVFASAALGFQAPGKPNRKPAQPSAGQPESAASSTNLLLVLEGPMAICKTPKDPEKIVILIPLASKHFSPGIDADLTERLTCPGEYSLDLPKDNPPRDAEIDETPYEYPSGDDKDIRFDRIKMDYCPFPNKKFLSLTVNRPDSIISMTPTYASITVNRVPGNQYHYAARTMLYYEEVDLSKLTISKLSYPTDKCEIKVKDGRRGEKTVVLKYPAPLKFLNVGDDKWLFFSMTPSEEDDYSHTNGIQAYRDMSDMLRVDRSIKFPTDRGHPLGPHNDCRVAQMLITPETKK